MRIKNSTQTNRVSSATKSSKGTASSEPFKPNMGQETLASFASSANSPIAPTNMILALQGIEDPIFAKKKATKRGQSMLDILENMKADMLSGQINEGHLNRLLALTQQAKSNSEPELDALIEDIELRARVELAKLGYFANY